MIVQGREMDLNLADIDLKIRKIARRSFSNSDYVYKGHNALFKIQKEDNLFKQFNAL